MEKQEYIAKQTVVIKANTFSFDNYSVILKSQFDWRPLVLVVYHFLLVQMVKYNISRILSAKTLYCNN